MPSSGFVSVSKATPLNWTDPYAPHVLRNAAVGGDQFYFDENQKLVCYVKSYRGGPDDYLESLIETFGKTDRDIQEELIELTRARNGVDSATRRTTANYTFEHVLVRLVFVKIARPFFGQVKTDEFTHVIVVDRQWATKVMGESAASKRNDLEWLKKVATKATQGDVKEENIPELVGTTLRNGSAPVKFRFADPKENANVAEIELRPRILGGGKDLFIHFNFHRHVTNKAGELMDHPRAKAADEAAAKRGNLPIRPPEARAGANVLSKTPISDLVTELNSVLLQEYFPPKSGTIQVIRRNPEPAYFEWRTADYWKVICGTNDSVTLEKLPRKDL